MRELRWSLRLDHHLWHHYGIMMTSLWHCDNLSCHNNDVIMPLLLYYDDVIMAPWWQQYVIMMTALWHCDNLSCHNDDVIMSSLWHHDDVIMSLLLYHDDVITAPCWQQYGIMMTALWLCDNLSYHHNDEIMSSWWWRFIDLMTLRLKFI